MSEPVTFHAVSQNRSGRGAVYGYYSNRIVSVQCWIEGRTGAIHDELVWGENPVPAMHPLAHALLVMSGLSDDQADGLWYDFACRELTAMPPGNWTVHDSEIVGWACHFPWVARYALDLEERRMMRFLKSVRN